ncbi:hypothetical protein B0H14DRAFT_3497520 [Mycena olivaceomarginata]|nr:hypothetical protein B0H14DRAFT_3497520 [Mycena olivaceomarginata]
MVKICIPNPLSWPLLNPAPAPCALLALKLCVPVRAVRLVNYDPLNRFVAAANIDPDPRSCLYARVPEDQIMCEFFVTVVEAAYDPRAGETETIRLARFTGFPGNAMRRYGPVDSPRANFCTSHNHEHSEFVLLYFGFLPLTVGRHQRDFYSPPSPSAEMLSGHDVLPVSGLATRKLLDENPTFLLAGHETTSSAIAWALHSLSLNQEAQTKLREELLAVSSDSPDHGRAQQPRLA